MFSGKENSQILNKVKKVKECLPTLKSIRTHLKLISEDDKSNKFEK